MTTQEKLEKIVKILDSKKAENIQVIGITNLTIIADYFIIATGTSTTQVKSLADEVDFQLGQLGIEPRGIEGVRAANWISVSTNNNKIILDIDITQNPLDSVIHYMPQLKDNEKFGIFTVNSKNDFRNYMPYVESITSDKVSEIMLLTK